MTWIIASGIYNLGFGLFHLTFWRLLNWKEQLPRLSSTNRAVMQALNLCLTFFLLLSAYTYLIYPDEIRASGIGRVVAAAMLIFWIFRAVQQLVFFDLKMRVHRILLGIFGVGIILHGAVAMM